MFCSRNPYRSRSKDQLAGQILLFSFLVMLILGIYAVASDKSHAMPIFNATLPVVTSWVGTVLAHYFGRRNFEAANRGIQEMAERLSVEQRGAVSAGRIMRRMAEVVHITLDPASVASLTLATLCARFSASITRLPLLDRDGVVLYLVHESSINKFLSSGGNIDMSFADFIAQQKAGGIEYGLGSGFVVAGPSTPISSIKMNLEGSRGVQDAIITPNGAPNERALGWISNIRLAKYLDG